MLRTTMKQEPLLNPALLPAPAALAHSYLSFPPLSSPHPQHKPPSPGPSLAFIPGIARKSPESQHQNARIQVLSLFPDLVSQTFYFHPLFSCPLFSSKQVHSKTQSGSNTPLACYPAVHPADLLHLFLYLVSAYSNRSVSCSGQTDV